jgi:polysaccharide pyruvyl transferase WcaK-like protein
MRLLVVHAWLKGNLGDVLQLTVLLNALRQLQPRVLDLAGFPASPPKAVDDVLALTDRFIADPFAWYWQSTPRLVVDRWLEPRWKARRAALFSGYDAIISAPGPFLADYDRRAPGALADIAAAADLGRLVALASHSVGPLSADALKVVARASIRIAREPRTHTYLDERGIASVSAADLAFLYPYERELGPPPLADPYRVLFLRSNNLRKRALRIVRGALFEADREIAPPSPHRLVLATSDRRRDRAFIESAARRLGVASIVCGSVPELVRLVAGASEVVSDRYHPAICGAVLGKPTRVLPNREPHKMTGLTTLLEDRPVAQLQDAARAGVSALHEALRAVA